jgi:uncharacterized protein
MLSRPLRTLAFLLFTLGLVGTALPALAGPLDGPKSAGLIGERPDGFLGFVTPDAPADVKALVDKTNAERRAEYEKIAAKNNTSLEAVEAIVGPKLIAKQPPGYYVMNADGSWVKK